MKQTLTGLTFNLTTCSLLQLLEYLTTSHNSQQLFTTYNFITTTTSDCLQLLTSHYNIPTNTLYIIQLKRKCPSTTVQEPNTRVAD